MNGTDEATDTFTILKTLEDGDEEFLEEVVAQNPEDAVLASLGLIMQEDERSMIEIYIDSLGLVVDDEGTRYSTEEIKERL